LGLVFAGGFLYFAYWMTRLARDVRGQSRQTNHLLDEIAELLAANLRAATSDGAASTNGSYVATKNGTMFHKPDCALVAKRGDLRNVSGKEPGMEPCKICDPLAPSTQERSSR
jgi:hypothetical protein